MLPRHRRLHAWLARALRVSEAIGRAHVQEWPNAQMHLYGSCANSFGTSHSDVDVCLEMEIGTEGAVEVLLRLADVLRTDGFENVEVNPSLSFATELYIVCLYF